MFPTLGPFFFFFPCPVLLWLFSWGSVYDVIWDVKGISIFRHNAFVNIEHTGRQALT